MELHSLHDSRLRQVDVEDHAPVELPDAASRPPVGVGLLLFGGGQPIARLATEITTQTPCKLHTVHGVPK